MTMLEEVKNRQGKWDLDHFVDLDDDVVMKELLSYKYMRTKSASVLMGWCLKRHLFTVDTHVYRIAEDPKTPLLRRRNPIWKL